MQRNTAGSTSRRAFVKCGLLSTGVLIGSSSAGAAGGSRDDRDDEAAARPIDRGVMRSYQYTAGQQVTVDDAVEWQPASLEGSYRTYVISYEHTPSYQAFLFVPESGDTDDGRSDDAVPQAGDALSIGAVQGSPPEATNRYVTVGLEAQ